VRGSSGRQGRRRPVGQPLRCADLRSTAVHPGGPPCTPRPLRGQPAPSDRLRWRGCGEDVCSPAARRTRGAGGGSRSERPLEPAALLQLFWVPSWHQNTSGVAGLGEIEFGIGGVGSFPASRPLPPGRQQVALLSAPAPSVAVSRTPAAAVVGAVAELMATLTHRRPFSQEDSCLAAANDQAPARQAPFLLSGEQRRLSRAPCALLAGADARHLLTGAKAAAAGLPEQESDGGSTESTRISASFLLQRKPQGPGQACSVTPCVPGARAGAPQRAGGRHPSQVSPHARSSRRPDQGCPPAAGPDRRGRRRRLLRCPADPGARGERR
jgi:hypothetical protein